MRVTHFVILILCTDTPQVGPDLDTVLAEERRRSNTTTLENHWRAESAGRENDHLSCSHNERLWLVDSIGQRARGRVAHLQPDCSIAFKDDAIHGLVGKYAEIGSGTEMAGLVEVYVGGVAANASVRNELGLMEGQVYSCHVYTYEVAACLSVRVLGLTETRQLLTTMPDLEVDDVIHKWDVLHRRHRGKVRLRMGITMPARSANEAEACAEVYDQPGKGDGDPAVPTVHRIDWTGDFPRFRLNSQL